MYLTKALMEQEEQQKKAEKESEEKVAKADKSVMGEGRPPMEDEAYLSLLLLRGEPLDFMTLVCTPMTGWSVHNAFFDGIKYCGSLA